MNLVSDAIIINWLETGIFVFAQTDVQENVESNRLKTLNFYLMKSLKALFLDFWMIKHEQRKGI